MKDNCVCQKCGKLFRVRPSKIKEGRGKHCSRACADDAKRLELGVRFWRDVKKTEGCWLWIGRKTTTGYGYAHCNRTSIYAHRLSWELHFGAIPDGLFVLHKCDNRSCVNPDHLFLGTHIDNMRDMREKGRAATGERNPRNLYPERYPVGDKHPMSKRQELRHYGEENIQTTLTEDQVRAIREEYIPRKMSARKLAKKYKVDHTTILNIVHRKTWILVE